MIKVYLANQAIKYMNSLEDDKERESFLWEIASLLEIKNISDLHFTLDWSSLLEYIGFSSIFEGFPVPDEHNKIFTSVVEVLKLDSEKDVITYLYDQIFIECLNQLKALRQIHPQTLYEHIEKKLKTPLFKTTDPFAIALQSYVNRLIDNTHDVIHDLILYLAWDRTCVYLAALFDHMALHIKDGLEILRACLIESFEHITNQGKTHPGFFRFVEALYAYEMKDEILQKYSDADWKTLCESSRALKPRNELPDISYIDATVVNIQKSEEPTLKILTFDSLEKIKACLSLSDYMLSKLKTENPQWEYTFSPREIVCLMEKQVIRC